MDPYAEFLQRLEVAGVRHLVIGAFGINLYAQAVGVVVNTADCDVLLPPDPDNLGRAVRILEELGYELEAGGEPLIDADEAILRGIVRALACVRAVRESAHIDLPLGMAGADFESLWRDQREARIGNQVIRVAPLAALIRSKEIANRPKDRLFLEVHKDALLQALVREKRKNKKPRGGTGPKKKRG